MSHAWSVYDVYDSLRDTRVLLGNLGGGEPAIKSLDSGIQRRQVRGGELRSPTPERTVGRHRTPCQPTRTAMSVSVILGENAKPATSQELATLMADCNDILRPCSSVTKREHAGAIPNRSTCSRYRENDRRVVVHPAHISVRATIQKDGGMYALVKK